MWDAASGKPVAVLKGDTGWLTAVAVSPDGSRIATARHDGTALLWIARESARDQVKRRREQ